MTHTDTFRLGKLILLALIVPTSTIARPHYGNYRVGAVEFKDNGRIDAAIVADCDIDHELRVAAGLFDIPAQDGKTLVTKTGNKPAPQQIDIQIDKVAHIAWGSEGARNGGTEIGIIARVALQPDKQQPFRCRSGSSQYSLGSHCPRIRYCSKEIAKKIASWLAETPH